MYQGAKAFDVLVLNGDGRPLSIVPLSLRSWQEVVPMLLKNRVYRVASYDRVIHSQRMRFQLPSVVALRRFYPRDKSPPFTRYNILLRDGFTCQYCNKTLSVEMLTLDHVIPCSRGGKSTWENVVTACGECNQRKRDLSLKNSGMTLLRYPIAPTCFRLDRAKRFYPPGFLHNTWLDYLYWDSPLETED